MPSAVLLLELGLWRHPEQRALLVKATQRKGEPITMEVQFCASNGQIHDGTLSAQKVELDGEAYLISTFLDTTERKMPSKRSRTARNASTWPWIPRNWAPGIGTSPAACSTARPAPPTARARTGALS